MIFLGGNTATNDDPTPILPVDPAPPFGLRGFIVQASPNNTAVIHVGNVDVNPAIGICLQPGEILPMVCNGRPMECYFCGQDQSVRVMGSV